MKKVILLPVIVAALSTVSCRKNYNCLCTVAEAGFPNITTTTTIDNTKAKATSACNSFANSTTQNITVTCSIQ